MTQQLEAPEPGAQERAFELLDEFVAEQRDELAWIVAPFLYTMVFLAHQPRSLGSGHPAARWARRWARTALVYSGRRGRRMELVRSGRALFTFSTDNEWRVVDPVIEALKQRGQRLRQVSARPRSTSVQRRAMGRANQLAAELGKRVADSELPFGYGESTIEYSLIGAARDQAVIREELDRDPPDVVVATAFDIPYARALALEARRRGIPSLLIPHASMLTPVRLRDLPFDQVALRGESEVAWHQEQGADSARLAVIGNPALAPDPIGMTVPKEGPVVLAPSPDGEEVLRTLIECLEGIEGEVVLAPHPAHDRAELTSMLPAGWRLWPGRTYDLLREGATAVVQYSSGVGLEAMLLGIPCLELALFGRPPTYPFLDHAFVERVAEGVALPAALDRARQRSATPQGRGELRDWARSWCAAAAADATQGAVEEIFATAEAGPYDGPVRDAWQAAGCRGIRDLAEEPPS